MLKIGFKIYSTYYSIKNNIHGVAYVSVISRIYFTPNF